MKALPTVLDLDKFDEIIDVRSPDEYAEDHIPGAINCPVLDNEQRIQVGTLHKQVSPFEAKKIGAALVAENIARHLRERFLDRPMNWKPLIYCWRGGNRSGAMTTIFRSIGWKAGQLDGGYKNYRRHVLEVLEQLPTQFNFQVICGATGSGKTRVLQAIGELGEQILDLEALANHKGSVLGLTPGSPQPPQKWFETLILEKLKTFDPTCPVYVEAESRKIGNLHVPETLILSMRRGACCEIVATPTARIAFLQRDYDYFLENRSLLLARLRVLRGLQSPGVLQRWESYVEAANWPQLVEELLCLHYDPLYEKSQERNYSSYGTPDKFTTDDLSVTGIQKLAMEVTQSRMRSCSLSS